MKLLIAVCLLFVVHSVISKDTKYREKTAAELGDRDTAMEVGMEQVDDFEQSKEERSLSEPDLNKRSPHWVIHWPIHWPPRRRPHGGQGGQGGQECYASGDPHYKTFDGRKYNFMGSCQYIHATDGCGKDARGRPKKATFKIVAINKPCGRRVSCVRGADVTIGGETIHLKRGTFAPAPLKKHGYTVTRRRNLVVVNAQTLGITVTWDRLYNLRIKLAPKYRGKVCGLCGNYDGNAQNDLRIQDGAVVRNIFQFANSWRVGHCPGQPPVPPRHPCDRNPGRKAEGEKDCAVMKSEHFKDCAHSGIPEKLYEDCVFDACASVAPVKESTCESIEEASQECKDKGKQVSWGHLAEKCKCRTYAIMRDKSRKCCVFPFIFDGVKHYKCAPGEQGGKPWCAIVPDVGKINLDQQSLQDVVGKCV